MTDLARLTDALLTAAKTAGADQADALAVSGTSVAIDIRAGKLETAERSEAIEIGLRVLIGGRQACVSASDISDATVRALAERAVAMAREAPADPYAGLAEPGQIAQSWDLNALEMADPAAEPTAAELEAAAREVESAAMAVKGVTQVEAPGAYSRRAMHLAASNGFSGGYGRTSHSLSAVAFTGQGTGMERDWAAEGRIFADDMPGGAGIGQWAGERPLQRAGAIKPKTGTFPVLFDERVASSLIGHLLSAANGSAAANGAAVEAPPGPPCSTAAPWRAASSAACLRECSRDRVSSAVASSCSRLRPSTLAPAARSWVATSPA